jgi:hypothetical protein
MSDHPARSSPLLHCIAGMRSFISCSSCALNLTEEMSVELDHECGAIRWEKHGKRAPTCGHLASFVACRLLNHTDSALMREVHLDDRSGAWCGHTDCNGVVPGGYADRFSDYRQYNGGSQHPHARFEHIGMPRRE